MRVIMTIVAFTLKISALHFFGLQDILFSLDHVMNCPTKLADGPH